MQIRNTVSNVVLHSTSWQPIQSQQILYSRRDQFEMRAFVSVLSLQAAFVQIYTFLIGASLCVHDKCLSDVYLYMNLKSSYVEIWMLNTDVLFFLAKMAV
jgi:hypothetical protein